MSNDVPYDKEVICDNCGKRGGYDFMGDCYCPDCLTSDKEGNTIIKDNPGDWKCPKCGNMNGHQAAKCEFCDIDINGCPSCQRLRELAGELADFAEDNYPMIFSCKRGVELKQQLKSEGVVK